MMGRKSAPKWGKLIDAADGLVYLQGFHETTLAEVAERSGVPLGNVYYYFKTKEELALAVIARRAAMYRNLAADWGRIHGHRNRIVAFVEYVEGQGEVLSQSGCPIGSLCQELQKAGGPLAERAAGLFSDMLKWLEKEFAGLGCGADSAGHAEHLVAALQGAALLSASFGDSGYIRREVARTKDWLAKL